MSQQSTNGNSLNRKMVLGVHFRTFCWCQRFHDFILKLNLVVGIKQNIQAETVKFTTSTSHADLKLGGEIFYPIQAGYCVELIHCETARFDCETPHCLLYVK